MNSDNYEFAKSSAPQGVDMYTPFQDKQWNYLNDINSGVYSNNSGLTNVQFDLTSIYNSGKFCNASDLFLTIPIVNTAVFSAANGVPVAPVAGNSNLLTMKSNFQHLIHQIEIVANGKTVNDTQPFISLYQNFKLLSSMSTNDLKQFGSSFGLAEEIDNEKSVVWSPVAAAAGTAQNGVGLCNNRPFVGGATAITGSDTQAYLFGAAGQNTGAVNKALARRATRVVDSTLANTGWNRLYGSSAANAPMTLMSATQLANEFKPYYTTVGNVMVWYDLAVIPLKYLCDVVDKLGLVKKLDMVLRLYLNTGSLQCAVLDPNLITVSYGAFSSSTFANTCPFTINALPAASANGGVPATTVAICAGCFVARAPTTAIGVGTGTVNIGLNVASHPMPSCRTYYSLIQLEPSRALAYIEGNREKSVVFENIIFNQYSSIPAGGSFSQLVQSGIKNPLGVCIIPLIGAGTNTSVNGTGTGFTGTLGFEQWQSPYDTCPATYSPLSLTNLQVSLGGQQVLSGSTLYYTFETFLEQVALAESLTSTDLGIGCGLINQSWWETVGRVYWIDLARGRDADKASMRNLSISFNNNTNASITLMVFTVYLDKITIDVETGIVKK
jgi:hypothetical protein